MGAGNEARPEPARPLVKERVQLRELVRLEGGESGERRALVAVEGGGDTPDAAAPRPELLLLCGLYSCSPYGGSVTTAWMLRASRPVSQCSASAWMRVASP